MFQTRKPGLATNIAKLKAGEIKFATCSAGNVAFLLTGALCIL
ncbi:hypothetical protein HanXRQr2_Chr01g0011501 [Helianthus annuus]|nr:hypothetical protein HanXRQr2_Chr01g0011501 [Helianthus annuus]